MADMNQRSDLPRGPQGLFRPVLTAVTLALVVAAFLFLADQLSAATKIAKPKDPRAQKLIDGLKDWNGIADADSPGTSIDRIPTTTARHRGRVNDSQSGW